jgi:hypothetical protein
MIVFCLLELNLKREHWSLLIATMPSNADAVIRLQYLDPLKKSGLSEAILRKLTTCVKLTDQTFKLASFFFFLLNPESKSQQVFSRLPSPQLGSIRAVRDRGPDPAHGTCFTFKPFPQKLPDISDEFASATLSLKAPRR